MTDHPTRATHRRAARAAWLVALPLLCWMSAASAETVLPVATNLESSSEQIISYRHQERMWQTADGALHLVINRGSRRSGGGLALFSSFDGGRQWQLALGLADTDKSSTVDGELTGDRLSLVHGVKSGGIRHRLLAYDPSTRTWASLRNESAFVAGSLAAQNPAAITDRQGVIWCAFLARDAATGQFSLRLLRRDLDGRWSLASDVLGGSSSSKARSARPVLTADGVGISFRVRNVLWWAERLDASDVATAWAQLQVNVDTAEPDLNDPFASHFSAVKDDLDTVHVVVVDDRDVLYLRRDPATRAWTAPRAIDGARRSVYVKMGLSGGKLFVSIPTNSGSGAVLTSVDGGASFVEEHSLVVPPPANGITYKYSRHEMPQRWTGALPILQQYEQDKRERLMLYEIVAP
ncbi:MAG: hypothetical protein MUF03_04600 [Rubrivivax sp.]|nr:hypothetical protein [Rubrivivax sp.]